MRNNPCSQQGCRLAGRVPCVWLGFFFPSKSFILWAANPLALAPANHLKPFTWSTCSKQRSAPEFWQKFLATQPSQQSLSDHGVAPTETLLENRRDHRPLYKYFCCCCFSPCVDWCCSFHSGHPNFPYCSPFMSTVSIEKKNLCDYGFPATSHQQLPVLAAQRDRCRRKETQNYMVNLEQSGPLQGTVWTPKLLALETVGGDTRCTGISIAAIFRKAKTNNWHWQHLHTHYSLRVSLEMLLDVLGRLHYGKKYYKSLQII